MTKQPTPMERHIDALVDHLKHSEDTQAGFMSAIDHAKQHARDLEERCERLAKQNEELRMAFALPFAEAFSLKVSVDPDFRMDEMRIRWKLEPFSYEYFVPMSMRREQVHQHIRKFRWHTMRGALKAFRKMIQQNFDRIEEELLRSVRP